MHTSREHVCDDVICADLPEPGAAEVRAHAARVPEPGGAQHVPLDLSVCQSPTGHRGGAGRQAQKA